MTPITTATTNAQGSMSDGEKRSDTQIEAANSYPGAAVLEKNEFGDLTFWQSIKKWRRIVWYCVGLSSAILMYGYDYVIVGTVSAMPSFQYDFGTQLDGEWILPSLWLGLWNFISPGCSMIGAIIGGSFQDRYGRRMSLATGTVLSALGVAICFVSNLPEDIDSRRGLFLAGKGFQGGAIGMIIATIQTYMSEILPPNLRGPLLAFIPIFTLVGQLLGAVVIHACIDLHQGYIICFGTQWPLSVVPVIMAFVIPESPTYLVRKDRFEAAFKSQKKLDHPGNDTQKTIDIITANIEHERQQAKATYADSFRGINLRRTLIIMFANCIPQIFGLTLLAKGSYYIQLLGMPADFSIFLLMFGIIGGLLGNIAGMWTVSKFGRRTLVMWTLGLAGILWGTQGICGFFSGTVIMWYSSSVLTAVIILAGLGAWPCAHIIGAETSALHLRGKANGIGWFTGGAGSALFGFVLPYIFNPDQGNLRGKTGFVYFGLCIVGVVVTFLFVPEMKGRTPSEIDHMFELQLPARQFRHWVNDGETRMEQTGQEKMRRYQVPRSERL